MRSQQALEAMLSAAKAGPPESDMQLWIEACQELADVIEAGINVLTDEQVATLVGIGALVARQGRREMEAGHISSELFSKLSSRPPP